MNWLKIFDEDVAIDIWCEIFECFGEISECKKLVFLSANHLSSKVFPLKYSIVRYHNRN